MPVIYHLGKSGVMFKNIIKVLLSNLTLTMIGLANSIIFPIILNIGDYAYYQEYMLYVSYINICHLGIASGMFLNYSGKEYESIEKKRYKSEIYLICLALCFFTIIGFGLYFFYHNKMILFVTLTIIPHCIIASFLALYQAFGNFTKYAVINVFPKLVLSILIITGCLFGHIITGSNVISINIIAVFLTLVFIMLEFRKFTAGVKSSQLFSKENMITLSNGFLITLGNYINLLFHSIDKQYVNIFFEVKAFATYSFAMSMQSIMMIFITSLANPIYVRMSSETMDNIFVKRMKELLFMFGAYSGCAYFAVAYVIKNYITKYFDSIIIIRLFFAVFPAMAVINILYINLYKSKRKIKKYIMVLIAVLVIAALLNGIVILANLDYPMIAFATMVTYYVWLVYSQRDFEEINITRNDILYLVGFLIIYFGGSTIENEVVGFVLYAIIITAWNILSYKKALIYVIDKIRLDHHIHIR